MNKRVSSWRRIAAAAILAIGLLTGFAATDGDSRAALAKESNIATAA